MACTLVMLFFNLCFFFFFDLLQPRAYACLSSAYSKEMK